MPEQDPATRREQIMHYAIALASTNEKLRAAKLAKDQAEVRKQSAALNQGYIALEKAVMRRKPP